LHPTHATGDQVLQEGAPERHVLTGRAIEAEHLTGAVRAHPVGDHHGHALHPSAFAHVLVARIQPQIRVHRVQAAGAEELRLFVQHAAQATHLALADARDAE
jgi:hypothetical protein